MATQSIWIFGYGSLVWRPNFEYSRSVQGYIKGWRRVWWQGSTDHRGTPERPGRTVTLHQDPQATTWGVAYELAGSPKQQLETLKYLEWREKQYDIRQYVDLYSTSPSPLLGTGTPLLTDTDDADGGSVINGRAVLSCTAVTQLPAPDRHQHEGDHHTGGRQHQRHSVLLSTECTATGAGAVDAMLNGSQAASGRHYKSISASSGSLTSLASSAQVQQPEGPGHVRVAGCLVYIAGPDKSRNANYLGPASLEDIGYQIAHSHGPSGPNRDYLLGLANAMRQMGVHDEELFQLEQVVLDIARQPAYQART